MTTTDNSQKMIIESSRTTPYVFFDPDSSVLEIRGNSSPEDAVNFYSKIIHRIESVNQLKPASFNVKFEMNYFNTSSAKCLFDVLRKLEVLHQAGINTEISWCYEEDDDDMMESGEDYQELINLPFKLVAI